MDSIEKLTLNDRVVVELRKIRIELNDVIEKRIEALEAKLKQMEKDDE